MSVTQLQVEGAALESSCDQCRNTVKEIIPWPLLQHLSSSGEGRFSSNVVLGEDVTLEMQAWRMEL